MKHNTSVNKSDTVLVNDVDCSIAIEKQNKENTSNKIKTLYSQVFCHLIFRTSV